MSPKLDCSHPEGESSHNPLNLRWQPLEILQCIDDRRVFRAMGYPSLFVYAVSALKLSESLAYQFIGVARKSKEVPELKAAVTKGEITVSTASRVVSVINKTNQEDWIHKAKSLTQKNLEMEVAKENPKELIPERIRPVAEERLEMRLGISPRLDKKLARIKDLLSQKTQRSASLEDTLDAMADTYLEKYDPIQKAERLLARLMISHMCGALNVLRCRTEAGGRIARESTGLDDYSI